MTWRLIHLGASKVNGADPGMIPGKVTVTGLNEGHLPPPPPPPGLEGGKI